MLYMFRQLECGENDLTENTNITLSPEYEHIVKVNLFGTVLNSWTYFTAFLFRPTDNWSTKEAQLETCMKHIRVFVLDIYLY